MRETIKKVLDRHKDGQGNMSSDAFRDMLSVEIEANLSPKLPGDDGTWVCSICGKSTYDVDYDYIGSGTNHLGCELKIEMDNKAGINPNDDSDYYTGPEVGFDEEL